MSRRMFTWAYGVTTIPKRYESHLLQTLASLAKAGFDKPRLFVDGAKDTTQYDSLGLEVTIRNPQIRTAGNWTLSAWELYLRQPSATYFAIFQDDLVTSINLRQYLEQCEYPEKGYWNLYTFPVNQKLAPEGQVGWFLSNQMGKGAVATVYSRLALMELLASQHIVDRVQNVHRGHKAIDGGIITAMQNAGWKEYVHNPSLVQHTGDISSMGNGRHPKAESFCGETFDVMDLVNQEQSSE